LKKHQEAEELEDGADVEGDKVTTIKQLAVLSLLCTSDSYCERFVIIIIEYDSIKISFVYGHDSKLELG